MPKEDAPCLGPIPDAARKAVFKIQRKPGQDFDQDRNLRLALTDLLQIIGEACRRISREFRNANPQKKFCRPNRKFLIT
jgi:uncharacterized protein with HEPN domain